MMKRLITILFVSVAFLGCEPNPKPEKPENLISREKMVDVLHDMFIVSSAKGISRIKLEKNGLNPELYQRLGKSYKLALVRMVYSRPVSCFR